MTDPLETKSRVTKNFISFDFLSKVQRSKKKSHEKLIFITFLISFPSIHHLTEGNRLKIVLVAYF